jgi:PAS domain S-box-containing protein
MSLSRSLRWPVANMSSLAAMRWLVATYAVCALAWVSCSDAAVRVLAPALHGQRQAHTAVEALFVLISAALMYAALCRMNQARDAAEARHVQALQERSRSAQLLQTLADNSPDAIFAKDREGRYVLFNRAAARAVGADPGAVLGRFDSEFFAPQVAQAIAERDREVMQHQQPQTFEETIDTVAGPRIFLTTKGALLEGGSVIGLFGIARDVTERVHARERLRLSEQRFRLAAAGGHVWDWDVNGQMTESQSSFWHRLGHEPPPHAESRQRLFELMHPDDRETWQAAIEAHIVMREPYELEFRARHRNGHWRWFRTQGQAVWNEHGRATYMAGTTFDVTDRRQAEDALLGTQSELSHLSQRLMEQERETTLRLAQALHDRLGQVLGSARLHLDLALAQPARGDRLGRVSSMLDEAIAEVRRVLVELRPPLLQEQGLAAALDNEVRRDSISGLDAVLRFESSAGAAFARWPDAVEHAAFMIARESLANALQHAQAGEVCVRLDGDGEGLDLHVQDDGRGIADEDRHGRPGHLGLVGMRERAASIGAVLAIERGRDGGTTVHLRWRGQA